jgi:hypothetical protein
MPTGAAVALVLLAGLGVAGCASLEWSRRVTVSPCAPPAAPSGTLLVRVLDVAGLPVSGVNVRARAPSGKPVAAGVADASGKLSLRVTPPSPSYEVAVSLPGFYPSRVRSVRVDPDCTVELQLRVGVDDRRRPR